MGKILKYVMASALVLSSSASFAEGIGQTAPEPLADYWENEEDRRITRSATYIVGGILLAFLLVNTINESHENDEGN